jgi:hypothetical protein
MKFPFSFDTKLIFRLILPGLLLAVTMAPWVHWAMHAVGIWIKLQYALPVEAIAWGFAIVMSDMPIYMLFEGRRYWPGPLYRFFRDRENKRRLALIAIMDKEGPVTRRGLEAGVEHSKFPIDEDGESCVEHPTRLGNLIESYEVYPEVNYGLDAVFYWYRLWLMLDKDTRAELDIAQSMVDCAVYVVFVLGLSGLIFFTYASVEVLSGIAHRLDWSFLEGLATLRLPYVPSWPALILLGLLCFLSGFILYRFSLPAHAQYGELFKAVFDQYRAKLEFDDVVKQVEIIRGAPYAKLQQADKYRIAWLFLRWHRIRDEKTGETYKPKDFALVDLQAAEPFISVGSNDVEVVARGIGGNRSRLIFHRVPLVDGRHPHVLGGALGKLAPEFRQLCSTHDQGLCHRSTPGFDIDTLRSNRRIIKLRRRNIRVNVHLNRSSTRIPIDFALWLRFDIHGSWGPVLMRFLGVVALCAVLSGCAASKQEVVARLGQEYIGQNIDTLVVRFGPQ